MEMELTRFIALIQDKSLRDKVTTLIRDSTMNVGDNTYAGIPLNLSPASLRRHHSYEGGLLQHLISSTSIALTLCEVVERIYRVKVDKDVVLAAIIVHDVMKPLTYCMADETYVTSELGERIDHLCLIVAELIRRGFPVDVVHAVTAHHGRNSPTNPRTIEALICFLADYTDAALNGETLKAAKFLIERCVGEKVSHLRGEHAFAIVQAKSSQGCDGVKNVWKQMGLNKLNTIS
jgi:7,8-dihydroneopterin 2',3'-cyclic phosphate phosphodiesterase